MKREVYLTILYDYYEALLTDKQRQYFTSYYFDNLSFGEIGENFGVSRNAIFKQIKTTQDKLLEYENVLKCYDKDEKISKIMQSIEIRYVSYFNLKYDRVGHLFQDRFHSKRIGDREYLKLACRYIHQNPAKAGIAKTEEYKWSSYKEYIKTPEIINNKLLLLVFSKDENVAKQEFIRFHNVNANEDKKTEITNILEYELNVKFTDDEIRKYICDLLEIKNVYDISKYNAKMRKEQLLKIKCLKKVSISQLARVLGINRKIIERTLKNVQKEPSLLDMDTKRR